MGSEERGGPLDGPVTVLFQIYDPGNSEELRLSGRWRGKLACLSLVKDIKEILP